MAPKWLNKARNAGRWLQKAVGDTGRYINKAVDVGRQVYRTIDDIEGGVLTRNNPIAQGAKAALNIAGAVGNVGQAIGNARRVEDVGGSLQGLYRAVQDNTGAVVGGVAAGAALATGVPVPV